MDEDVKAVKKKLSTLNRAYSDLVARAILSIHLYEEYLMDKASSRELAVSMKELLDSLPNSLTKSPPEKARKGSRRPSKDLAKKRRSPVPPKGKDDQEEDIDMF